MFIEVVDHLRCPRAHEASWLVAAVDRLEGRNIVDGTLACPLCGTRYPVADGVADLRVPELRDRPAEAAAGASVDVEEAVRLAAMLDLTQPGGLVVLCGAWGAHAAALALITDGLHILAIDAPAATLDATSRLRSSGGVPLRAASARGIALDAAHATPRHLEEGAAALRARGRMVAPLSATLPATLTEIARDDQLWVAERTPGVSATVTLGRAERDR